MQNKNINIILGIIIGIILIPITVKLVTIFNSKVYEEEEFSIRLNEEKRLQTNPPLTIKLYHIDDSRCPKDVECYWEGELAYSLKLNGEYERISTVENRVVDYKTFHLVINSNKSNANTLYMTISEGDKAY